MITKTLWWLLGGSLLGWFVGFILSNSVVLGFCTQDQYSCREFYNQFGDPLFIAMPALSLVLLVLLFTPRAFPIWKQFAIWFVPLAAVLFALYPEPGSGDMFSPYPEQVYRWVSGLFVVISLGIIAWAHRR